MKILAIIFQDDVSSLDDPNDDNYVPETPKRIGKEKKRISLTQSSTSQKSPKESKKGQKRKPSKSRTLPQEAVQKETKKKTVTDESHDSGSEENDAPRTSKKKVCDSKEKLGRNSKSLPKQ